MSSSKTCCQRITSNLLKFFLIVMLLGFLSVIVTQTNWIPFDATKYAAAALTQLSQFAKNSTIQLFSSDSNLYENTSMSTPMQLVSTDRTETTSSSLTTSTISASTLRLSTSPNLETTAPVCPNVAMHTIGAIMVSEVSPSFEELDKKLRDTNISPGGHWKPSQCTAQHRVAIVIPYRNRESQLRTFLNHMHPFLQRQQLDYSIVVVEQAEGSKFNRAMLMNIGFVEAKKLYDWQCFIFHDVDLLPEDDRNLYSCPVQPRHMSAAVSTFEYKLPYAGLFGGISALSLEQFENVNGFSNKFFGWGGEDDDLSGRVREYGYPISRYPMEIARYKMLSHKKDEPSPDRFKYLYSGKQRYKTDGLNSLKYKLLKVNQLKLYTLIQVEINEEEVMNS